MINVKFTVHQLVKLQLFDYASLDLVYLLKPESKDRYIAGPNFNRPGLALSGYFKDFGNNRIQIFGRGETSYIHELESNNRFDIFEKFFRYYSPCVIFTHSQRPPQHFTALAEQVGCPILQTPLSTTDFTFRLAQALSAIFAESKVVHGVLLEIFGMGTLITGVSGIGKSEAAVELVDRGHIIIADDSVALRKVAENHINGTPVRREFGHHMELRGLGIINIAHLFGISVIRNNKQVDIVIELEAWDKERHYDRVGDRDQTHTILGIEIPYILIPIRPGRNIPILIEVAVMNQRLKQNGINAARDFNERAIEIMKRNNPSQ